MTQKNLDMILDEANSKSGHSSFESGTSRNGKNGTLNLDGHFNEAQFRAMENFRRRIYDAWSVLVAAGIIEKTDNKLFRYNSRILEGKAEK